MSSLDIACTKRAEAVASLKIKRDFAERHLNDGQALGSLGAGYVRMAQSQRQVRLESIEGMKAQIAELEGLEGEALKERFCPDVLSPSVNRGTWLGPILDPA